MGNFGPISLRFTGITSLSASNPLHAIIIRTKTVNHHSNYLKMCSHILQNLAFESSEIAVSIRPSYFIEHKHVSKIMTEVISCSNSVHESNI